ncbi:MAG: hypothetical protein IKY17_05625 [Oscillospiraceae bacterium]|nr:hypothetical protein [Oscillospiraceae bacterium]
MYNRYIQQQDGSYRKNRMPEQSPPRPELPRQETPPPPPPSRQGQSAGGFLRSLLPKNLDTGDLAVVLLLLLIAGDSREEQNTALLTLALYLFL